MSCERIYVLGVNHKNTSIDVRERLRLAPNLPSVRSVQSAQRKPPVTSLPPKLSALYRKRTDFSLSDLLQGDKFFSKDELVIISTCNRTELVGFSCCPDFPSRLIAAWSELSDCPPEFIVKHMFIKKDEQAIRHVFALASSLDSMLLGESQILGQVKQAFAQAVQAGSSGTMLNKLFHQAFYTAKQVRAKTRIGFSSVSLANVAVEFAATHLGALDKITVLLAGAGEMAGLTALQLYKKGCVNIIIANRSAQNAAALAGQIGGTVIPLKNIVEKLPQCDLLISACTTDNYLLKPDTMQKSDGNSTLLRPLLCIDLSLPRTLHPELRGVPGLTLFDLDDIQKQIDINRNARENELESALEIVEQEVQYYLAWQESLKLKPTIADLYQRTRIIADKELSKTLRGLPDLDEPTVEAIQKMLEAIVKKYNHAPVSFLKRMQSHHSDISKQLSLLRNLFGLDRSE